MTRRPVGTWESSFDDTLMQASDMLEPFKEWLIKKRLEVESSRWSRHRHMLSMAPLARQAMADSPSPSQCGPLVVEVASCAVELIELDEKLELLNPYYFQLRTLWGEESLDVCEGDSAGPSRLWEWYQRDLAEAEAEAKAGGA